VLPLHQGTLSGHHLPFPDLDDSSLRAPLTLQTPRVCIRIRPTEPNKGLEPLTSFVPGRRSTKTELIRRDSSSHYGQRSTGQDSNLD
jgi:hypothetical protein